MYGSHLVEADCRSQSHLGCVVVGIAGGRAHDCRGHRFAERLGPRAGLVRLHRRPGVHTVRRKGLLVVPIEHCLIDVATTLDRPALEALFDAAIGTRVNWRAVAQLCEQSTGRHAIGAVREQLRTCCPLTRSEPERLVARALSARNFPLEINVRVGRYYGDLVCRRARVIAEIDGREFHTDPATFNNDRKRQNELVDDDWRILRYSAATAIANLDEVVDDIIRVVRERRRSRRA